VTDPKQSKAFGPFSDHSECVLQLEDDPSIDDPSALCADMEAHPDEYFSDGGMGKTVLQDLSVTFVSGVDVPAQDSQFVLMKSGADAFDRDDVDWSREDRPVLVLKATDDGVEPDQWERKTWAPVLIPGEVDKQGDLVPEVEIERAAHEFLKTFRNIDTDHNLLSGKGVPVESWTLKEATTFVLPDGTESREYPVGTWMLGIEWSEEAWKRITAGELTGLSIFGEAASLPVDALTAAAESAKATTVPHPSSTDDGPTATFAAVKAVLSKMDEASHGALSEILELWMGESGADESAPLSAVLEWAATADLPEGAAEFVQVAVDEFLAAVGREPGEMEGVMVGDFIRWMADDLEQEQGADVVSVARAAEKLQVTAKSIMKDDEGSGTDPDGGADDEPTLTDIAASIEKTHETVVGIQETQTSLGERVTALESGFETMKADLEGADPGEEPEGAEGADPDDPDDPEGEGEEEAPPVGATPPEGATPPTVGEGITEEGVTELVEAATEDFATAEDVEAAVASGSEKAIKSLLGIDDDELDDLDDERKAEVIRKAAFEVGGPKGGERLLQSGDVTLDLGGEGA